ncbi:hormone-sensitive lipase isoform X2 [Plutella xylostella]|uniref:hormone-sensitive lipase isoform X2 n=1 Tax=Plutella xylostella TaxID=51655 RepID=UPI002032C45D|nr:hormone-sensitive lipase isoform X2 [Plutella xylostella]
MMSVRVATRGLRVATTNIYRKMSFGESPAKASMCCKEEVGGAPPTFAMYEALKDSCQNNATYFQPDDTENGQRLYQGFMTLIDHIDTVWPLVDHVRKVAPLYDLDAVSPGNGYRSFVSVVDSCVLHGLKLSRQVCTGRDTLLFRKGYFVREVESCGQLLASLGTCLHHLHTLLTWAPPGELFPSENHTPEELFATADTINQYCFYGRCLGFQFLPSMRGILKGISICMAGFSEAYYSHGNLISSVWTGGQYLLDPELRARRIVNISQSASVDFCKAFWFLAESEIMKRVPSLMSSTVAVNRVITIPPEPVTVSTLAGESLTVSPPTVHIGLQSLNLRLISVTKRTGMDSEATAPPADGIVFHCHGGGFVAQSSKSHEMYLRDWAAKLNVPILSVDYSLAPQAPFPRALEEVFYAYCWMLNNFKELGTTGKRIVFAGDSAGANLIAGCTLKLMEANLRQPGGLFMAYAPLLISFIPSPARLLCLMDPLLPFGFMMRCLKAYASPTPQGHPPGGIEKRITDKEQSLMSAATTPGESNGFLKISASQASMSVELGSFSEVSTSELGELQAHKSGSERRQSSDTTVSAELQSEHTATGFSPNEEMSQKCVSDFLEKYVLESDTESAKPSQRRDQSQREGESETSSTLVGEPPLLQDTVTDHKERKRIKTRISEAATGIMGAMSSRFAYITGSNNITRPTIDELAARTNLDALIVRSPSDEFIFSVPRDPYLSPYWADDELLKKFPPVRILTVHLDPCLDDCVMFARKLRRLGAAVSLDVLEGLPHGFLNFSLMAKEANEGSKLCVQRIKELLDLEAEAPTANENTKL